MCLVKTAARLIKSDIKYIKIPRDIPHVKIYHQPKETL